MTVLEPTKGVETRNGFVYAAQFTLPALDSAKVKWQAREQLKATTGRLTVGSRVFFWFDSDEFMNTPGGRVHLLVEISDDGQKWSRYVQSTHESGLFVTPVNQDDPQTWTKYLGCCPDLWDGEAYEVRITATSTINVTASLQYLIL